eukprot:2981291-Prymnesium_polylepis.1
MYISRLAGVGYIQPVGSVDGDVGYVDGVRTTTYASGTCPPERPSYVGKPVDASNSRINVSFPAFSHINATPATVNPFLTFMPYESLLD